MKKHLPNFITCLNLVAGAFGCIAAVQGDFGDVIYYVLLGAGFDFLDGMVARLLKVVGAAT